MKLFGAVDLLRAFRLAVGDEPKPELAVTAVDVGCNFAASLAVDVAGKVAGHVRVPSWWGAAPFRYAQNTATHGGCKRYFSLGAIYFMPSRASR